MSFNIATSGLNAITEQLNAISNNIANSGTVGSNPAVRNFPHCMRKASRWA
ncbi:flagellar hook protein [Citrobacter koseri]|nr:flagellar hook protein [Citrobacter koseri]